ncbi:MAG: hypothetical protein V3S39_08130 [Thermodesulfobacteriota bacterium]
MRMIFIFFGLILWLVLTGGFSYQGSSSLLLPVHAGQTSAKELTRVNAEGPLTIRIVYLNPLGKVEDKSLAFEVGMDTHSVDLDRYKMENHVFLLDDKGRQFKPLGWFSPQGGGHHRSGIIKFPALDSRGKPVLSPGSKSFQLVITDVGGVAERRFQWIFPLKPE